MARNHDRISYLTEVILESASGRQQARISDLSLGGCFIDTIADIPIGDAVSFVIEHADGPVRVDAQVRYRLPGIGLGVEFDQETPALAKVLESASAA